MDPLPLLYDHHHHPGFYAALSDAVDLADCADAETALARLAERCDGGDGDRLHLALGWHAGRYTLSPEALEPLPPLVVCNLSLHGFRANRGGRALLSARDAECAERLSETEFVERNLPRIFAALVDSAGLTPARLAAWFRRMEDLGLSGAEEMFLAGEAALDAYLESGMIERSRLWCAPERYAALPAEKRKYIRGWKLFADGALGAASAALGRPYRTGGGAGLLLHDDDALAALLADAHAAGLPVALHALGDRAVAQVARVAARLARDGALPGLRVEHAQFIPEADARILRDHAIALCMQPNFSDDSRHYLDRLPDGYAERNNPFRMLIDRVGYRPGVDLLFGSDGMPSGAAPALAAALQPPHAGQRLTRAELFAGYGARG